MALVPYVPLATPVSRPNGVDMFKPVDTASLRDDPAKALTIGDTIIGNLERTSVTAQSSAEAVAYAYREVIRDYHREIRSLEAENPAGISPE